MSEHGGFLWYELATNDVEAARKFYGDVIGWETERFPGPDPAYWIWTAAGQGVGGVAALTAETAKCNAAPHWIGYVQVADADAVAQRTVALGGRIHIPPHDLPMVGRLAVLADPQGAVFALIRPAPREGAGGSEPRPDGPTPGRVTWRELLTDDAEGALRFYGDIFGWKEHQALDMGPAGAYRIYGQGGQDYGGIFKRPSGYPLPPHFLFYVHVDDLDAATARVKAGGGKVWMGPMPIPTGTRITQCADPQGAVFALHGT